MPAGEPADLEETFKEPDCDPSELCLAEPDHGFQIRSVGTTIEPGEDVEFCEAVLLPGGPDDVYYVSRFEVAMTEFSHHLIVSAVERRLLIWIGA